MKEPKLAGSSAPASMQVETERAGTMRSTKTKLYAIAEHGKLVLFDGRAPIYWLRKVAKQAIEDHGGDKSWAIVPIKIALGRSVK